MLYIVLVVSLSQLHVVVVASYPGLRIVLVVVIIIVVVVVVGCLVIVHVFSAT